MIKIKIKKMGKFFRNNYTFKVKEINLKKGNEITIFLQEKRTNLRKIFGALKYMKIDAQKFKDDIRKEEFENLENVEFVKK